MNRIVKSAGFRLLLDVVFAGFVTFDWYRFATSGKSTESQGVFADPHLEIWLDVNARMPGFARQWACAALMQRQAAEMGGNGPEPSSCQKGFGVDDGKTAQVTACVDAAMRKAVAPALMANLNGTPSSKAGIALNTAAGEASKSCLAELAN